MEFTAADHLSCVYIAGEHTWGHEVDEGICDAKAQVMTWEMEKAVVISGDALDYVRITWQL